MSVTNTDTSRKIVDIIFFDAGGGHRNAMTSIKEVLEEKYPHWIIRPVDFQKLLEPIDPVFQFTQKVSKPLNRISKALHHQEAFRTYQLQTIYNHAIKHGITHGLDLAIPLLQESIKFRKTKIEDCMASYWLNADCEKPDIVLSVIPHFNKPIFNALRSIYQDIPFTTIVTDMLDTPPHFWMENQDQHIICGTKEAEQQAFRTGFYDPEKIHYVSGMLLKKSFYNLPTEQTITHKQIGLSDKLPTAIIMFGGNGSFVSEDIVKQFSKAPHPIQTIVLCGKNKELFDHLSNRSHCHPVGFTTEVAAYMRLADIFIGKPGPGSISEAIHMGCPVIIENNLRTMPQERPNVAWVTNKGIGVSVKNLKRDCTKATLHMLENLDVYQKNIKLNVPSNIAVFEIASLLDKISEQSIEPENKQRTRFVSAIKTNIIA